MTQAKPQPAGLHYYRGVPANVETVRDRKEKSNQNQTTNEEQQQTKKKRKLPKSHAKQNPSPVSHVSGLSGPKHVVIHSCCHG